MRREIFTQGVLGAALVMLLSVLLNASTSTFTPRRAFALEHYQSRLYAIGGWNGQATQLDLVETIDDSLVGKWIAAPPLIYARSQHMAVAAEGRLFVLGGWSADMGLVSAVEVFDGNIWSTVTHLPTPRREPAAAILQNKIVIAGGFNGRNDSEVEGYSAVVEAYDWKSNQWQRLASLRHPRRGLTMVNVGERLYAIGGYTLEDGFIDAVERYDPLTNTWESLAWKIAPRTWSASVVVDDSILIIGGYSRNGFLNLVERIDPRTGAVCYPKPLRSPRSWLSAAVLKQGILTLGGEDPSGMVNTLELIDGHC
jgi:non-specific serine/threonine protein kinase